MDAIRELVQRRYPGATILAYERLGDDERPADATTKGTGYGVPVRVVLRDGDGVEHAVVFHTARADDFGHDRRADRAAAMLLAYDTYGNLPRHVPALDVGVITRSGELRSIADATELYLLTGWKPGRLYAEDLSRIADSGATPRDLRRLDAHPTGQRLARHLDALLLLDRMPGGTPPAALAAARVLPPQAVGDREALARLLTEHRIDQVVEVADVDTAALSAVCAERGVDLVTASIHRKDVAPSTTRSRSAAAAGSSVTVHSQ